jgi:hypothetical protein
VPAGFARSLRRDQRYDTQRCAADRGEPRRRLVRAVFLVLAVAILTSGCDSDEPPASTASQAGSEEILKKDCADPKWREQNLGLWYSVCRQPMRW